MNTLYEILVTVLWWFVWVSTIFCSIWTVKVIVHDDSMSDGDLITFAATPILWAVIIMFWFN